MFINQYVKLNIALNLFDISMDLLKSIHVFSTYVWCSLQLKTGDMLICDHRRRDEERERDRSRIRPLGHLIHNI